MCLLWEMTVVPVSLQHCHHLLSTAHLLSLSHPFLSLSPFLFSILFVSSLFIKTRSFRHHTLLPTGPHLSFLLAHTKNIALNVFQNPQPVIKVSTCSWKPRIYKCGFPVRSVTNCSQITANVLQFYLNNVTICC